MTELQGILDTIREVEESLARRSERAGAVVMMTWGVVATSIFVFYGVAHACVTCLAGMPDAFHAWAWVPPILVGYLLTAITHVRLGRMRSSPQGRGIRRLLVALLVPVAIVTVAILSGSGWELIPAIWVAFLGFMHLAWGQPTRVDRAIGVASFALALALAAPMLWEWSYFVAAAWYAVFLFGHGAYRYHGT